MALTLGRPWQRHLRRGLCWLVAFVGLDVLRKIVRRIMLQRRFLQGTADLPSPDGVPHFLLGYIPMIVANLKRLHCWKTDETVNAGRPSVKVPMGIVTRGFHDVWSTDPMIVQHILKDNFDDFTKPSAQEDMLFFLLNTLLGPSIFLAQHGRAAGDGGKVWSAHRKVAAAIFSRKNFNENMGRVFQARGRALCNALRGQVASTGCSGLRAAVDVQELFFAFTMESILEIFFGQRDDSDSRSEYTAIGTAFDSAHRDMMDFFMNSLQVMGLADLAPFPFGGVNGLLSRILRRAYPSYVRFEATIEKLDSSILRLVRECRQDPQLENRKDLLALFMRATNPSTEASFSDKDLRDIVLNFLIAGRDTTACLLTWIFYELALNADVQDSLAKEVIDALPSLATSSEPITYQSVMPLPLLNGVVYEALRLHPPVPLNYKSCAVGNKLPNGSAIPGGTKVFYLTYAMGRDPSRYTDPLVFRPSRWIPFKEPSPYEFPVFQGGPRICSGKDMALFEAKILTAMLIQRFSFSLKEGEAARITYGSAITMSLTNSPNQDSHNLWLHVTERA